MLVNVLTWLRSVLKRFGLLPIIKRYLYAPSDSLTASTGKSTGLIYCIKVLIEKANFSANTDVHNLPAIHDYWSSKFILPRLGSFGYSSIEDYFYTNVLKVLANQPYDKKLYCVSMGSGNCDFEIKIAEFIVSRGHHNFEIECVDFNKEMLKRGSDSALRKGLLGNLNFTLADANSWRPSHTYDVAMANMSLHHIVELEKLFDAIKISLKPNTGRFIVFDMIGRNGHMRWPEALSIVNEYWPKMSDKYKFNNMLARVDSTYINFDCSKSGFEGIRAQDILPLLHSKFHFESFFAFANLIECFIDRSIGPNFDPNLIEDRNFIDEIQRRDEAEMVAGVIKPTHMLSVMSATKLDLLEFFEPLTPDFSIRATN